jgi:hypothetical protein
MKTEQRHQLLAALSDGEQTTGELVDRLAVHRTTVRRWLQQLLADGEAERTAWGRYRLEGSKPSLSSGAAPVLAVVEALAPDAHLTGFDVLAPYAHQFLVEYPHLVYAEPTALDTAAFRLAEAGFVVVTAGGGSNAKRSVTAAPAQTVVLRAQPNAEQYGVHGPVASREKAWVDTLRETHRGQLPFDFVELGRVMRALLDRGGDVRKLRNYARRMGYVDRVNSALADSPEADMDAMTQALRAGVRS